jgi:hypothetical protein
MHGNDTLNCQSFKDLLQNIILGVSKIFLGFLNTKETIFWELYYSNSFNFHKKHFEVD